VRAPIRGDVAKKNPTPLFSDAEKASNAATIAASRQGAIDARKAAIDNAAYYKANPITPTSASGTTGDTTVNPTGVTSTAPTPTGNPIQLLGGQWVQVMSDGSQVPIATGMTNQGTSASDDIKSFFTDQVGGSGMSAWAAKAYGMFKQGIPVSEIMDQWRSSPEYATRFPAMASMVKTGSRISESAYIVKESADRAMLYQYLGPTAQAYDNPAQLGTLMTNFVSTNELQSRLQNIHDAVNSSADTKSWLKANYGYSDQDLAAAWLNPQLTSDAITRRESASQIGGAGLASGFGNLSQTQAEALANQGVTQGQAQSVFGKIGNMGQLQSGLPGNETGSLTQQQLLDAGFTDGAPREKLAQLQSARVAQFQQSGGVIADSSGVVGGRVAAF
jgi:hypothetical protein